MDCEHIPEKTKGIGLFQHTVSGGSFYRCTNSEVTCYLYDGGFDGGMDCWKIAEALEDKK